MDMIELPTVDANDSLKDALETLMGEDIPALVTELSSGSAVLDIDLILHALRTRGNVKIGMLKPRCRTMHLPNDESAGSVLSNDGASSDTQDLMDSEGAAYAVTRLLGGRAELLTRHETYRHVLGGPPNMWRCQQDPNHVWLTPDLVQPGNRCRYDGSAVDSI